MSSSWGNSWKSSWKNSWGTILVRVVKKVQRIASMPSRYIPFPRFKK